MSGNREALERLMQAAANAAWDGKWEEAAEAYGQAVMEFPEDVDALTGLGIAYSSLGRSEEALGAYRRACDVEPYDAILRERVGRALEALGRTEEAASAYVTSGQQYEEHGAAAHLARARWEDAVRVHPACSRAHVSLLKQHQKTGRVRAAVKECLALARIYRDQERIGDAVRSCEHALELSPRNSQAVALLERLRREESPPMVQEAPQAPVRQVEGPKVPSVDVLSADALDFSLSTEEEPLAQEGNPVESTQRRALADLAESVFEGNDLSASESERLGKSAVDAIISKAIDFQTRGDTERAIAAYRQVLEAGASRPAVHFNLGVLYQDKRRFEDALTQFERAVAHPDYKLGSHFALGECYRARGLIEEALKHFVHVLKIVDLAMVEQEYSDDLADLYEHLINGYLVKGDQEQALRFVSSLVSLLSGPGWEEKVKEARQRLNGLMRQGPVVSLAEVYAVPDSERILEAIAASQEYVRRGMHYSAMEECHFALELGHTYLPVHCQLAEVSRAMGKMNQAVEKLVVIADAYHARGVARQAAAVYRQALKLVPMDTAVRSKLIDLLITHGEIEEALSQYLILADSYQNLARMDRAEEIFREALGLAPRVVEEQRWTVRILHKVGDIHMQRVEWKKAISAYERIRDLAPDDERARLTLMGLLYRLGQPRRAAAELDGLLEAYRDQGRPDRVFAVLDDVVDRWPDVVPLRARLAQAHLNAGHKKEALKHLDHLGALQLEAGRVAQARATIEAIVALQPPNVDEYRTLLEQLDQD